MSPGAGSAPARKGRDNRRHGDAGGGSRQLADHAPAMIRVASLDCGHVYFNRSWLEFTGRPVDDEFGTGWYEGVHPEDREALMRRYREGFEAEAPFEAEFRLRRHDGRYRWLIEKVAPLHDAGVLQGFAGSCLDISERAHADEQRARQLASERTARAAAEAATLARDQFIANLSHELRSPLNGIKSWTHVLESQLGNADPATRRAIDGIMIGVEQQVRLIDDLLDAIRAMGGFPNPDAAADAPGIRRPDDP